MKNETLFVSSKDFGNSFFRGQDTLEFDKVESKETEIVIICDKERDRRFLAIIHSKTYTKDNKVKIKFGKFNYSY